jgi:hypothetical protein
VVTVVAPVAAAVVDGLAQGPASLHARGGPRPVREDDHTVAVSWTDFRSPLNGRRGPHPGTFWAKRARFSDAAVVVLPHLGLATLVLHPPLIQ